MKRVLLTGATGFIGRHCVGVLLERGYEVHAISSMDTSGNNPDVHWHQIDLLDALQTKTLFFEVRPSHLLHLAWYTVPGEFWVSEENLSWVRASLCILQEFAQNGGKRVVAAGTCAEYDWNYGYCSEGVTPLAPLSFYGACKHSLQSLFSVFAKEAGLSGAWGRIFFLFGPYEHPKRLVPYVIRSLLRDAPALCSHGKQTRDFLYVQDVAEAFVALLDSEVSGAVNIASGRPIVLRDLIYLIAEMGGNMDLAQLGALPTRDEEPIFLVADVRRLQEEVGWRPKYTLEEGITETIDWWRQVIFEESC